MTSTSFSLVPETSCLVCCLSSIAALAPIIDVILTGSDEGPWNHSFRFEQYASEPQNQYTSLTSRLFLKQTRPAPQSSRAHRSSHRPCNSCSSEEMRLICYIRLPGYACLQNLGGFREEHVPEG
jgi:hypothetical protein